MTKQSSPYSFMDLLEDIAIVFFTTTIVAGIALGFAYLVIIGIFHILGFLFWG